MKFYQIFSLAIIATFYIAYFLKALVLTLKGIKVNQMGFGDKSGKTKIIEQVLKSVTFFIVPIQLGSAFLLLPLQTESPNYLQNIGMAISICGTICFIAAMLTMGKSWRAGIAAGESTNFIKHGIYRISRNPAFLGFDLFYIGILLILPGIIHAIAICFVVTMFHLQILEEEKSLIGKFGDEYRKYKSETKRYFLFF